MEEQLPALDGLRKRVQKSRRPRDHRLGFGLHLQDLRFRIHTRVGAVAGGGIPSARSDPLGDLQRRGTALATAGTADGVRNNPTGQTGRSDHRSRKPDRESEGLVRHGRDSVERSDGADRTRRRSKMDDQGRHSLRREETAGRRGANSREGEGRAESGAGGRRNDCCKTKMKIPLGTRRFQRAVSTKDLLIGIRPPPNWKRRVLRDFPRSSTCRAATSRNKENRQDLQDLQDEEEENQSCKSCKSCLFSAGAFKPVAVR